MPSHPLELDEHLVAAYVRGELTAAERSAVETALDQQPHWLAVVAALSRAPGRLGLGSTVGRYRIDGVLGRGGHGVVHAAWDPQLRRDVALKLVDPAGLGDARRAEQRLLREARALGRVSDPHVVRVLDAGTLHGRVWIAMERLDGGTLDDWRAAAPRTWREVVALYIEAGHGLAAAHAAGIVHRDFKPSNAMLDRDGRVVVLDFGLARGPLDGAPAGEDKATTVEEGPRSSRAASGLTRTGAALGTPAFMPPEQRRGGRVTAAADQYSLCAALWEALEGRLPDDTKRRTLPPLAGRGPASVRAIVRRGVATAPEDRWPDLDALLGALQRELRPRTSGRRMLAAAGVVVLLALVLGRGSSSAARASACALPSFDWSGARRSSVAEALASRPEPFAARTADVTVGGLDAWARAHADARGLVCDPPRATPPIGEPRDDEDAVSRLLRASLSASRRGSCLERERVQAEEIVAALLEPDADVVQRAVAAVSSLRSPSQCVQAELTTVPGDPSHRAEARALHAALAEVEAARTLGRMEGLQARAEALRTRAEALGHPPLVVSARLVSGNVETTAGAYDAAERALDGAAELAMSLELPRAAAEALTDLAWVVGHERADALRGRRLVAHARSWSVRAGAAPALEGERLRVAGHVELTAGEPASAAEHFAAGTQLAESMPASDPERESLLLALENGWGASLVVARRLEDAEPHLRRALTLAETRLGQAHPSCAEVRNNLAALLQTRADYEGARELLAVNLEMMTATYGEDHPRVGTTRINLAVIELYRGRDDDALRHADAAVEILERALGPDDAMVAKALVLRADAQLQRGRLASARADLERARRIFVLTVGEAHVEVGIVDSNLAGLWLDLERPELAKQAALRSARCFEDAFGAEDPRLAYPWVTLATALEVQGERAAAIEVAERAVAVAAVDSEGNARTVLGRLLLAEGELARARTQLEEAARIHAESPSDPLLTATTSLALARALAQSGEEPERARRLAQEAAEAFAAGDDEDNAQEARDFVGSLDSR